MSEEGEQPQVSGEAEEKDTVDALELLASNPEAKSAIAEKLATFINAMQQPSLPPAVQRKVKALKNVQLEVTKLEAEFYKEVQRLEAKYQALYQPLFNKRCDIVTGSYEPTDEECEWDDEEEGDKKDKAEETKATDTKEGTSSESAAVEGASKDKEVKGIPDFWLTALKNTDLFTDMIKEQDEPVLEHLTDIKIIYLDDTGMDFRIEFHFSENEYFTNPVLTKLYKVACVVDEDAPFDFEGATITGCEGCKIDWRKGKNVTVRTVKKKQKPKGRGQSRTIVKTVPQESFFTTFSLPERDEMDEEEFQELLADDYVRAEFLRDRLVPKAVLFFTGEALEEEEEEEYNEDGDRSEEDEEEDEDYDAQRDLKNAQPPDCKQQ